MQLLNNKIKEFSYYGSSESHLLPFNNIGDHGENLTITFLSLNRIELSKRLLLSIKDKLSDFKGQVLIIDNGSEKEQLLLLKSYCEEMPFSWRIIELEKNFGVAGGRNRSMEFVKTDWVMCLDNDLYFIDDLLTEIKNTISTLGCHFLNVPLLDRDGNTAFAYGGNLYLDQSEGDTWLGGGSCFKQISASEIKQEQPFLSSFLFGGASIFKKETFMNLGGYDEKMFIGFEDIDFSIRVFQEGYKIGNIPSFCLVHDHPIVPQPTDVNYEKLRFSSEIIKESALYLESKYNVKIWGPHVINWLKEKNETITQNVVHKKKIALVVDVENWAFYNIATQIKAKLSRYFDFEIIPLEQIGWNKQEFNRRTKDCDIIHFFWRENITYLCPTFANEYEKVISTCVYDHLFLKDAEIILRTKLFNHVDYYVSSEKLFDTYQSIAHYKDPVMAIEDGVDPTKFYPIKLNRLDNIQKPLIVGWVGNSQWGNEDHKGFNTIIKPTIEYFEQHGVNIHGNYCDKVEKMVPHDEMVHYYSQIDVLVCMSKSEGTPNPVLEAMACGVPIISTDVGIVPQVLGQLQKQFILSERSTTALQQAILKIYHNRSLLKQLSEENLAQIKNWHWDNQMIKFKRYFENLSYHHDQLEKRNDESKASKKQSSKSFTFRSNS